MATTRRAVLLGGASSAALLAFPPARAAGPAAPAVPPEMFEPGIQAMADTVRSIVDMLKPSIVGVDYSDLRAVLQQGGRGAFGQGIVAGAAADRQ